MSFHFPQTLSQVSFEAFFSGWFAIMTSDGRTASYYSTVEQVASSKVTFFLTRYDVPSYTKTEESEWGLICY